MPNPRFYSDPPYGVAVIHGGPGAAGEMAPVARALSSACGVLEPLQTARTVQGQVEELHDILTRHAELPVTLLGYSWGAWLSVLLAAQYPALVRKLILISAPPFEESYTTQIADTRLARLDTAQKTEFLALLQVLRDPSTYIPPKR